MILQLTGTLLRKIAMPTQLTQYTSILQRSNGRWWSGNHISYV